MKRFLLLVLCMLTVSFIAVHTVAAESGVFRLEAENFVSEESVPAPAMGDDAAMSGGKFIGIDNQSNHVSIYRNIPKSNRITVNYRTLSNAMLHVFIEKNGVFELLIDISLEPTGVDYATAQFVDIRDLKADIPENSKLKFTAEGSVSIDYFEFKFVEEPVSETDGNNTNPSTDETSMLVFVFLSVTAIVFLKKRYQVN